MATEHLAPFERTVQRTNEWLGELQQELGRDDAQYAYRVLRAVLFALRDRLTVEEASDFAAQLPMLVRGIYYEGWNPAHTPSKERNREAFLQHVAQFLADIPTEDPETLTRSAFKVIDRHVQAGEIKHVKDMLPKDVRDLWP